MFCIPHRLFFVLSLFTLIGYASTDFPFERWRNPLQYTAAYDYDQNLEINIIDILQGSRIRFTDTTQTAGLNAGHQINGSYFLTGQAWGDFNRDGLIDLYVTNQLGSNTLYQNTGDGNFIVAAMNDTVALTEQTSGGAVFADYDNDGWIDLYVLNHGPNTLFRNLEGAGFEDVTEIAGVGDPGKGSTGAWGDYDGDGHLDLYVSNWFCEECPFGMLDRLFHNNGDGTFSDASPFLGLLTLNAPGFVASFVDYDNDGDSDIYLVNDKSWPNVLWRNDGPGCDGWCFTDVSESSGSNTVVDGMGLAIGDYDNDGDLDFYFSNIGPMVLLQNQTSQGSPTFVDVAPEAGVAFDCIGWGAVFSDVNNDGWLDLFLAVSQSDQGRANRMFINQGDGTFDDQTAISGNFQEQGTHGLATADINNDGYPDFIAGNRGAGYVLYRNNACEGGVNHWLDVDLIAGEGINRNAVGARVTVTTSQGMELMQEVKCGSSLGAGNAMTLHFGLGAATADQIEITWPNGESETILTPTINQRHTITQNQTP